MKSTRSKTAQAQPWEAFQLPTLRDVTLSEDYILDRHASAILLNDGVSMCSGISHGTLSCTLRFRTVDELKLNVLKSALKILWGDKEISTKMKERTTAINALAALVLYN